MEHCDGFGGEFFVAADFFQQLLLQLGFFLGVGAGLGVELAFVLDFFDAGFDVGLGDVALPGFVEIVADVAAVDFSADADLHGFDAVLAKGFGDLVVVDGGIF